MIFGCCSGCCGKEESVSHVSTHLLQYRALQLMLREKGEFNNKLAGARGTPVTDGGMACALRAPGWEAVPVSHEAPKM